MQISFPVWNQEACVDLYDQDNPLSEKIKELTLQKDAMPLLVH